MVITFPEDTGSIITEIRNAIGRTITFYIVASSTACSLCTIDPVTNTSTDSFCLQCNGTYWIPVLSGVPINAHIAWGKSDQARWESGGQWWEGSCGAQIVYTPSNLDIVEKSVYVVVDEQEMEVKKVMRRGVKQLNRILIDLIEKTKVD